MEMAQSDERYLTVISEIEKHKKSNEAMSIRLQLKNQEIEKLKSLINAKQENFSLQLHTIKAMRKPILADPAINHEFTDLRNLLESKKTELKALESQNQEFIGKPFIKGGKLQSKWQQLTDEAYTGFKEFAEGKVQDYHLVLQLEGLKAQETKSRIEENKEISENLEKEAQALQTIIGELQNKYKRSMDQLDLIKQEIIRLRRSGQ
ncbi:unnamed protein product [Blepharisma stoltei]|uniref:Uncharacterized protein n=1 Tax=Blepharisma stoltei TaxID=1481888 RepID=A0AAU9K0V7_9CILI|nr:unnamed protein product [Blepharisma stoltei]